MIGVSDGFDIDGQDWDGKVALFNFFTRMDNGFKRQRVRRGMMGAAAENRSLGKLPLGYTRRVNRNAAGVVETKPDGRPKHKRCLDPATKDAAYRIFQMYCERKLTPYRITRQLNQERVEGSVRLQLLKRSLSGV
ncbi:MAG TPA: hypothetical protein PKC18_12980 [Lacipirellulaceae bacterium]|nr:hypothetical protein [Lacipirellulaceae bacterium]HMP06430.1 hypothetical protein [Lacipirellulaceae bacterium]